MRGRGKKVTEDYVSMVFVCCTMVLPPKDQDDEHDRSADHQVKAPHYVLHRIPMFPEEVTNHGNYGHPGHSPQGIEYRECFPWHTQNACHRAGEDAQAENESGKENGEGTVACK